VTNIPENSTKVHCVSITLLLAFERDRKALKLLAVKIQVKTTCPVCALIKQSVLLFYSGKPFQSSDRDDARALFWRRPLANGR